MVLAPDASWLSSLWVCDAAIAEEEAGRERPAWTAAPGPLTVVCRSRLAQQNLEGARAASGSPFALRLAEGRRDMGLELARFAETLASPYAHLVVGSFDYEGEVADLLNETLRASPPPLVRVDCGRRSGEAYSFRGRSLCARFGLPTGGDWPVPAPPVDTILVRADLLKSMVPVLMRTPPDPGWFALALRRIMAASEAPRRIPLLLGAVAEARPVADASAWESHCLSLVEEVLAGAGGKADGAALPVMAARRLVDLVQLLASARSLSPVARRHVEETAVAGCEAAIAELAGRAGQEETLLAAALMCDGLGLAGPDTLEIGFEEGARHVWQRLADFALLAPGEALGRVAQGFLAAGSRLVPDDPGHDRMGALLRRLEETDRERRLYRAQAANASDELVGLRDKLRRTRARLEEMRRSMRTLQGQNEG
jgi:hypothetical protein